MCRPFFWLFVSWSLSQTGYSSSSEFTQLSEISHVAESLMDAYFTLYRQNENVFTVYYGKPATELSKQSLMLYRHICQEATFKPLCKPHKTAILAYFEARLEKYQWN